MPINVPTMDDFTTLANRVTKLEQASPVVPPQPIPPGVGMQAKRISNLVELMGYNTFSSVDTGNIWGSWPADYRSETVIAQFDYMYKGSGFSPRIREYHYAGRESWQTPWIRRIKAAYPDVVGSVCIGANGSVNDAPSIVDMTNVDGDVWKWGEGINEPNTNFGSGEIPYTKTIDMQRALQMAKGLMGPSIVFGLPGAENWIKNYFNNDMSVINSLMGYANGHYYPPHCPDIIGDGTSLTDVVGSLWNVYGNKPVMLTEVHSTLYNQDRGKKKPDGSPLVSDAEWDVLDAYYGLLMWFRSALCGVTGLWWYALDDYAQAYRCGMFATNASNPRPVATAVKRLAGLAADLGNKYTFTPEKIDVKVTGVDGRTGWDLYQGSDKKFYIPLWRSDNKPGGTSIPITVTLPRSMMVKDYDLLSNTTPRTFSGTSYTTQMPYGCRLLVIV